MLTLKIGRLSGRFYSYSGEAAADLLTKGVQVSLSGNGMRLALTAPFGGPRQNQMVCTQRLDT
jgi:hypothetical protein